MSEIYLSPAGQKEANNDGRWNTDNSRRHDVSEAERPTDDQRLDPLDDHPREHEQTTRHEEQQGLSVWTSGRKYQHKRPRTGIHPPNHRSMKHGYREHADGNTIEVWDMSIEKVLGENFWVVKHEYTVEIMVIQKGIKLWSS